MDRCADLTLGTSSPPMGYTLTTLGVADTLSRVFRAGRLGAADGPPGEPLHEWSRQHPVAPRTQKADARYHRCRPRADDRVPEDADTVAAPPRGPRRVHSRRAERTDPQGGQD